MHPEGRAGNWNTCAQAAATALLASHALGPYAAGAQPSEAEAIAHLVRTHPPDMPLGLGTTAFRLAQLLRDHGLRVRHVHSGLFGRHELIALDALRTHANAGWPVPVCVDDGLLGGRAFEAHWALVRHVGDAHVELSNARHTHLPLAAFRRAWACRALPYTHNSCALLVER